MDSRGDTVDSWFKDTCQQIQVLNYEIDACLRIFIHSSITFDHLTAFNRAVAQRDKLTAQVMQYLAEQIKPQTCNQPETITKPAPAPNNLRPCENRLEAGADGIHALGWP